MEEGDYHEQSLKGTLEAGLSMEILSLTICWLVITSLRAQTQMPKTGRDNEVGS